MCSSKPFNTRKQTRPLIHKGFQHITVFSHIANGCHLDEFLNSVRHDSNIEQYQIVQLVKGVYLQPPPEINF